MDVKIGKIVVLVRSGRGDMITKMSGKNRADHVQRISRLIKCRAQRPMKVYILA